MRLSFFLLLLVVLVIHAGAQQRNFQSLLDSGKANFKRQRGLQQEDYSKALEYLLAAVKANPQNAEAHYFLGYTVDRMNATDGTGMPGVTKDKSLRASEQFEIVNRLEKRYTGEMVLLDPYSKIGAIWGALAQAYLTRQLPDSATWAFAQGKKHGGFTEPILTYNRQLLNSCDSNAILITVGDNITFSCWYLQTIEHYRGDVTIVDANLVNTSWYPVYLKNSQRLAIGYNARELDTLSYFNWTERPITITNPANSSESFTWLLKPTYYGGYLLKGDRILLDILKHNLYSRTVYFSDGTDSTYNLFLDDYLTGDGIVTRLRLQPNDLQTATTLVSPNFEKYNISQLDPGTIVQSRDAVAMLNAFRYAFYNLVFFLYNKNELTQARKYLQMMNDKFPSSKLPYNDKELQEAIGKLGASLQ